MNYLMIYKEIFNVYILYLITINFKNYAYLIILNLNKYKF